MTWIRRLGRKGPESILNAPDQRPILEVAMRSGFLKLAEQPGRAFVMGVLVAAPNAAERRLVTTPEQYAALERPGFAKATANFQVEEIRPGLCRVRTQTRTYATDPASERQFARYWRVIYPGSSLIRIMWLRAIRARAERS